MAKRFLPMFGRSKNLGEGRAVVAEKPTEVAPAPRSIKIEPKFDPKNISEAPVNIPFTPELVEGLTHFEETVILGDPEKRGETPEDIRQIQLVYRREQARQLNDDIVKLGLDPAEIEYYVAGFEKNLCPSTGMENEAGILYNNRTGVSVPIVLEWVCEWTCGLPQWRGQYEPELDHCKPVYFFLQFSQKEVDSLR